MAHNLSPGLGHKRPINLAQHYRVTLHCAQIPSIFPGKKHIFMRPSFQLLTLRRPRRRARRSSAVSMSTPKPKRRQKPTVKTVKTMHATPNATTKGDSGKKFLGTSLVRFTSLNYSSRKLSSSGLEWPALDDKKQNMFTTSDYRTLAFGIIKCHRKHPARISSDTNVLSRLHYVELRTLVLHCCIEKLHVVFAYSDFEHCSVLYPLHCSASKPNLEVEIQEYLDNSFFEKFERSPQGGCHILPKNFTWHRPFRFFS